MELAAEWALVAGLTPEDLTAALDQLAGFVGGSKIFYEGLFSVGG